MTEIQINDNEKLTLEKVGEKILINGKKSNLTVENVGNHRFKVYGNNKVYDVSVIKKEGNELSLSVDNITVEVTRSTHVDQVLEKLGMNSLATSTINSIKAPMPGTILDLQVEEGTAVKKGDSLLILEAMKMENVIKSPGEGTIRSISVAIGDNVEKNQLLISLD